MREGDKVWTFRAEANLARPAKIDGQPGVITGIIPKNKCGPTRYEVTFDHPKCAGQHSFDFHRDDLVVI